jgi:cellulase/cellobiase CelA1
MNMPLLRRLSRAATAGLVAAAALTTAAHSAEAADSLGSAAAGQGRYFGTAVAASHLGEADYAATLDRESARRRRGRGPGDGTASCTATYTRTADWSSGYNGQVTITAGGEPISSWTATVTLPAQQSVSSLWNGTPTWSGNVMTVRSSWNGTLAAGVSTGFGFTVAKNGSDAAPSVAACTAS